MSGMQTHPQLSWNVLFRGSRPVDLLNLQFHGIAHHFLNRPSLYNQWSTNWRPVGEWESHLIFKMDQTLVTKKVRLIRTWLENMVSFRCWICPLVIPERRMWMELQTTCRSPYATGCPGTEKQWQKQKERERATKMARLHTLFATGRLEVREKSGLPSMPFIAGLRHGSANVKFWFTMG